MTSPAEHYVPSEEEAPPVGEQLHLPGPSVVPLINAAGADTFYQLHEKQGLRWNSGQFDRARIDAYYASLDASDRKADTLASAIEINRPVNLPKALRAMEWCNGVVRSLADAEILDAKARIGAGGLGCEPASAASVAGLRQLVREGVIDKAATVACVARRTPPRRAR